MEATETYSNQPVGVSEWSKCPSEVNLAYLVWILQTSADVDKGGG